MSKNKVIKGTLLRMIGGGEERYRVTKIGKGDPVWAVTEPGGIEMPIPRTEIELGIYVAVQQPHGDEVEVKEPVKKVKVVKTKEQRRAAREAGKAKQ